MLGQTHPTIDNSTELPGEPNVAIWCTETGCTHRLGIWVADPESVTTVHATLRHNSDGSHTYVRDA